MAHGGWLASVASRWAMLSTSGAVATLTATLAWAAPQQSAAGADAEASEVATAGVATEGSKVSIDADAVDGARLVRGALESWSGEFVAGAPGATLAFEGGGELRAVQGTRFRLGEPHVAFVGIAGAAPARTGRVISLERGAITLSLPARAEPVLLEGTRRLRVQLSLGELSASAEGDRAALAVREGIAWVSLGEGWRELSRGALEITGPESPSVARRALLPAPVEPQLSRHLLLEGSGPSSTTLVSWPALARARAYDVQVRDAAGEVILEQRTPEPRLSLEGLPPGEQRVSVCAVDDALLCGARSPSARVRVLGLWALPAVSRGRDGSVRLVPKQRLAVTPSEGLEIAYSSRTEFMPMPPTLGLVEQRRSRLLVRQASTGETLDLVLEPMAIRADVVLGDHRYGWPAEGLMVVARLVDADGYVVPDDFFVRARVTVNAQRVKASWQREGTQMTTYVEQLDEFGPWMVRVEIFDENGLPLGSNVTEIGYRVAPRASGAER